MTEEKKKNTAEVEEGAPVCQKCGSILIEEDGEFVCPDCSGEIDFFGGDESLDE